MAAPPYFPGQQRPLAATFSSSSSTPDNNGGSEIDQQLMRLAKIQRAALAAKKKKSTSRSADPAESLSPWDGLSRFHQSILSRTASDRQRFVTGTYPVKISFKENPTRKWLGKQQRYDSNYCTTELFVNGTALAMSLASLDRFHWLEDHQDSSIQQQIEERDHHVVVELLAEIHLERPGYVQILPSQGAGARVALERAQDDDNAWTSRAMKLLKLPELQQQEDEENDASTSDIEIMANSENSPPPSSLFWQSSLTNTDRLWVTGFSLAGRQGLVTAVDCEHCYIQPLQVASRRSMLWPNEVQTVPAHDVIWNYQKTSRGDKNQQHVDTNTHNINNNKYQDALLVCDGFLVPTKDRGGLYVVRNPGHESEQTVCLTPDDDRWFYHRAVWINLQQSRNSNGSTSFPLSILTARCQVSTKNINNYKDDGSIMSTAGLKQAGQLVWLECPKPAMIDPETGTPLEEDGTVFDPFSPIHMPWKTRVLSEGPDVMFAVADLDSNDDTVEVIASEFFRKQVSLCSIRVGPEPEVVFQRTLDEQCGQAFGVILADLQQQQSGSRVVLDSGSTADCLKPGDGFSHLLVTSHDCSYAQAEGKTDPDDLCSYTPDGADDISCTDGSAAHLNGDYSNEGGSLYAYQIPEGKDSWKTEPWRRTVIASGFKVRGKLNNMINPGAPGFVYAFHAKRDDQGSKRPLIAVAGDCAESAYIFRPENIDYHSSEPIQYKLMVEIQCQATVGSIGIGYDDFSATHQESGYAKLYVPCYEKDKILVFGLGTGEDDDW